MKYSLNDKIKSDYESRTQMFLPRRTWSVLRVDGKAFKTYTKGLQRPFDSGFITDMDETAIGLCRAIQGAVMAYVQSDEISVLMADFMSEQSDAWFDGNVQKIVSVSASVATSEFNHKRIQRAINEGRLSKDEDLSEVRWANFDSRVFTIPDDRHVYLYFVSRQQDATRNSIQSAARTYFSHKELNNKNTNEMQDMLMSKGINWNDYPVGCKRGRVILKKEMEFSKLIPSQNESEGVIYSRPKWVKDDPPIFTKEKDYILDILSKVKLNSTPQEKTA